jgi:hypothetical protein
MVTMKNQELLGFLETVELDYGKYIMIMGFYFKSRILVMMAQCISQYIIKMEKLKQ